MFQYFLKIPSPQHNFLRAPPNFSFANQFQKLSLTSIKLAASRTYDKTVKKVAADAMESIWAGLQAEGVKYNSQGHRPWKC